MGKFEKNAGKCSSVNKGATQRACALKTLTTLNLLAGQGLFVVSSLVLSTSSQAQSAKLFTPFADVTYAYDSNIFRKPDDEPKIEGETLADSSLRAVAGLALEKEIGRQKITARASLAKSKYGHFDFLNYDSRDAQANLGWRFGSHLTGNLNASRTSTLTPYIEFHENRRNLRVDSSKTADAAWRFHPSFRIRGSANQLVIVHDLSSQKYKDRTNKTAEVWLDYTPATGSALGLMVRHSAQRFPYAELTGSQFIINNQQTDEVKVKLDWRYSAKTQLQILAGVARQTHEVFNVRDYRGVNARVTGNWYPTGKIELTGTVWHEVDSTNNLTTNYAVSDGIRLAPAWKISSKMRLEGLFRFEKRVPVGIPGVQFNQVDKFASASLNLTYLPIDKLQLLTSLSHESLNSNLEMRSFRANSISFNAHYEY